MSPKTEEVYSSRATTGYSGSFCNYYFEEDREAPGWIAHNYFRPPVIQTTASGSEAEGWYVDGLRLGGGKTHQVAKKYIEKGKQANVLIDAVYLVTLASFQAAVYSYIEGKVSDVVQDITHNPKTEYKRLCEILTKAAAASRNRVQPELALEYPSELYMEGGSSENMHRRYHHLVDKRMSGEITGAENLELSRLETEFDESDEAFLAEVDGTAEWRARLDGAVQGIAELNTRLETLISRL